MGVWDKGHPQLLLRVHGNCDLMPLVRGRQAELEGVVRARVLSDLEQTEAFARMAGIRPQHRQAQWGEPPPAAGAGATPDDAQACGDFLLAEARQPQLFDALPDGPEDEFDDGLPCACAGGWEG